MTTYDKFDKIYTEAKKHNFDAGEYTVKTFNKNPHDYGIEIYFDQCDHLTIYAFANKEVKISNAVTKLIDEIYDLLPEEVRETKDEKIARLEKENEELKEQAEKRRNDSIAEEMRKFIKRYGGRKYIPDRIVTPFIPSNGWLCGNCGQWIRGNHICMYVSPNWKIGNPSPTIYC